jgi:hypothetical protein
MKVGRLWAGVGLSVPTGSPRPLAAVFSLPSLLVSISPLFSPLSVLTVILASYPACQGTTDSPQTWVEQVPYYTSPCRPDEAIYQYRP